MKQDTLTTAKRWWAALEYNHQYRLSIKHLGMLPNTLNEDGVFAVYEAEHPEQSLPSKEEPIKEQSSNRGEGDILEGKIVSDALQQWDNVGYDNTDNPKDTYIAGAKFIGIPLAKENQQLRESNTRLKERIEVLEEALTEWLQLKVHTLRNGIETIDANNKTERAAIVKAKEALNNK